MKTQDRDRVPSLTCLSHCLRDDESARAGDISAASEYFHLPPEEDSHCLNRYHMYSTGGLTPCLTFGGIGMTDARETEIARRKP